MRFSTEEKDPESDSKSRACDSLRMCRCNFAARDQGPVESFKCNIFTVRCMCESPAGGQPIDET